MNITKRSVPSDRVLPRKHSNISRADLRGTHAGNATAKAKDHVHLAREFFAGNASSYDDVVRMTTLGNDRAWKKRIVERLASPTRVLDLACGTGILACAVRERFPQCELVGVDLAADYLDVAKQRAKKIAHLDIEFVHSAAEHFENAHPFDAIVSSYLAKYAALDVLTANAAAMLKPGGILLMHEFTYPSNPVIALVWELYFPVLRWIPSAQLRQWHTAFQGLPTLVRETTWVADLRQAMQANGFTDIQTESLGMGTAAIVTGRWTGC